MKALAYTCSQLPLVGSSDHNAILIKPYLHRKQKPNNSRQWKRDLRDSRVRSFGQWITNYDWLEVFETSDSALKFQKFIETMLLMVDSFFPIKLTRIWQSDKPWMTSSLKIAIRKRQNALHKHGKSSQVYKFWRGKVQRDVKVYSHSVIQLKNTSPSRWWREIKTLGGLSSQDCWYHQLLSEVNPTCSELAETYNNFLVGLTSHFQPLDPNDTGELMEVPDRFLVHTGKVYSTLRHIKVTKSPGPDNIPNKILKTFHSNLHLLLLTSTMLQWYKEISHNN